MLGATLRKTNKSTKTWMSIALFPQAGVAIGMTLLASTQFPEYRQILLSVTINTTAFLKLLGLHLHV